jgi:hypothetical protein
MKHVGWGGKIGKCFTPHNVGCITCVHVFYERRLKLDPKVEKCIFIGYSLEKKGYKCFNLSIRKLQVSRDVVFDEMASWCSPMKIIEDGEAKNGDVLSNVEQESQLISGSQKFSISGSNSIPWKRRLTSSNMYMVVLKRHLNFIM